MQKRAAVRHCPSKSTDEGNSRSLCCHGLRNWLTTLGAVSWLLLAVSIWLLEKSDYASADVCRFLFNQFASIDFQAKQFEEMNYFPVTKATTTEKKITPPSIHKNM
ncbi:hypothetical protein T4B_15618 [Trichinella pseudospiralis]|uniref:Uncharacterized protein n=1 Tax=Trichinella pseudospiralis TaxID=6337 RepID=A0A0V1J7T0_TRIPS|nr:hypothetical protein T4B_15618 [Trichinella pseudospiralis]KRZ31043.1 hypothetical protein T4C_6401 [Trichinella pseudospiralis]